MPFRALVPLRCLSFLACVLALCTGLHAAPQTLRLASPDKTIVAELSSRGGLLRYRILVDGRQILAPSQIGLRVDGLELGEAVTLGQPSLRRIDESYPFLGSHATALHRASQASIPASAHGLAFSVDLEVANDGVAVRLRLPAHHGRALQADRSSWSFDGNPLLWTDKLIPEYESHYRTLALRDLGRDLQAMPLTLRVGGLYVTLAEAALKDYGDLALRLADDGSLAGELYADPGGWSTDEDIVQPWRVTILARDLTALVNSTFVQNLNPPPAPQLAHAGWIRPGRSSWQWLAVEAPVQSEQKQWIDWTHRLGFEYYLIDEGWAAWSQPWPSLSALGAYAKTQNVGIWLWINSKFLKTSDERRAFFRKVADAGIVGVKIDFPQPCNRWWSNWYFDAARDAADFHLLVDFHGANKPTGMERTWPNVLTREGIRGHEHHITRYHQILEPAHDTILPFTRYIVGPGDYTPTVFASQELQGITWAHELAQAIAFTSPFLCYGGHPRDFLANPALDLLQAIPPVWDETRVLPGSEPGKIAAIARRSGSQWFLAVLNGADAASLDLSLAFLGDGSWKATLLGDVKGRPDAWDRREKTLLSSDRLSLSLSARGGYVAWLRR